MLLPSFRAEKSFCGETRNKQEGTKFKIMISGKLEVKTL
jgi:hypothetical protein